MKLLGKQLVLHYEELENCLRLHDLKGLHHQILLDTDKPHPLGINPASKDLDSPESPDLSVSPPAKVSIPHQQAAGRSPGV